MPEDRDDRAHTHEADVGTCAAAAIARDLDRQVTGRMPHSWTRYSLTQSARDIASCAQTCIHPPAPTDHNTANGQTHPTSWRSAPDLQTDERRNLPMLNLIFTTCS